jgi:hypothetical protein
VDENPVLDPTGEECEKGEAGPVFFLFGTFGGSANRTCEVKKDKAIFFPIINGECDTTPPPVPENLLISCAVNLNDGVDTSSLVATLDGNPVADDLALFRATSSVFRFRLPKNNIFQAFGVEVPPGQYHAASDGYWVMLRPLPEGEHVLHFRGENSATGFVTDVTYHLIVD